MSGLASLAMQFGLARRSALNRSIAYRHQRGRFLSVLFLVAQLDLWQHLQAMGFYVNTNPANSYFYVLTALHGLHLMGGLIVLANVAFRVWYDEAPEALSGTTAAVHHLLAFPAGRLAGAVRTADQSPGNH